MQEQSSLAMSQVVIIFLLLVAWPALASAKSVCKCVDAESTSKKVVDYNVKITESGEQFNETIEVDTEKQTELFKVPAHNNVDHSNILHDFKMNLSMLLLPEKKICYLLPLDKELSVPRKLISDLDQAQKTTSKTTIIENKWTVGSEVTDRSVLSDELANFCAKYPIYRVKKLEDSMTATKTQTGRKVRKRRQGQSYPQIEASLLCAGGKNQPTAQDMANCLRQLKRWNVNCRISGRTCYYINQCGPFGCSVIHLIDNMFCCEYLCA